MDEKVKVVNIDTEPAKKSLADLRKELKETRESMALMDSDSDAFREAAHKAGELQHAISEIGEAVRGASSDFGDLLGQTAKVGAGITGAFQMASAALDLFGVESEEVAKSIKKMQDLMAMTQGLGAIDGAIKSFKKLTTAVKMSSKSLGGFKTALISTGLGALVVVLGSIIANWNEFTEAIGLSSEQLDKLGNTWGGIQNVLLKGIKGVGQAIIRTINATKDAFSNVLGGIGDAFKALFSGDFGGVKKALTGIKDDLSSSFKNAFDGLGEYFDVAANYAEGVQKAITKREAEEAKKREKLRQEQLKKEQELYEQRRKLAEEALNIELEQIKRNGKSAKEQLAAQIEVEKKRLALMKQGTLEYEQQLTKIYELEKELNDPGKAKKDDTLEKLQKELDALRDSYRNKEQILADSEAKELEILQQSFEAKLLTYEEYEIRKNEVAAKYSEERLKLIEEEAKAQEDRQAQILSRVNAVSSMALGALANTLDAFADMQDANTKEGFEKQKKLQIAAVTMDMLGGVLSAWTSAMNPANAWMTIWGQIAAGTAQTIATLAMGAAQIKKIKSTTFDGGGSTAGASASMSSAGKSVVAPVQYTQDIQGASIEGAIKDSKVYVTETDISEVQGRVSVAESESRY